MNNAGAAAVADRLRDGLQAAGAGLSEEQLQALSKSIIDFKNTPPRSGLLRSFDELSAVPGGHPPGYLRIEAAGGAGSVRDSPERKW